jgi:hypothetical protein
MFAGDRRLTGQSHAERWELAASLNQLGVGSQPVATPTERLTWSVAICGEGDSVWWGVSVFG